MKFNNLHNPILIVIVCWLVTRFERKFPKSRWNAMTSVVKSCRSYGNYPPKTMEDGLGLIKVRLVHRWIPDQWSIGRALTNETEGSKFDSVLGGGEYTLLRNLILEWKDHGVIPCFQWSTYLDWFVISP